MASKSCWVTAKVMLAHHILLATGNVIGGHQAPLSSDLQIDPKRVFDRPYPIEALSVVEPGSTLGIAGLGLSAIDVVLAMTEARGGSFEAAGERDGSLVYRPSGREPSLVAWSRSGLPLYARGVNEKPVDQPYRAVHFTGDAVTQLRIRNGKINFDKQLRPLLLADMERAFKLAGGTGQFSEVWESLCNPKVTREQDGMTSAEYQATLLEFLDQDVQKAMVGNVSQPEKAACDVMRDLRDTMRDAVEYQGLFADSHRQFNEIFNPLNNRLAVGPPHYRIAQLVALCRSGILDIGFGSHPQLQSAHGELTLTSTGLADERRVYLDYVVDSRVTPSHAPYVNRLLIRGEARRATNSDATGEYILDTLEVTRQNALVRATGDITHEIVVHGQAAEGTVWYTQVAARPFVNSRTLRDAAKWANNIFAGDTRRA